MDAKREGAKVSHTGKARWCGPRCFGGRHPRAVVGWPRGLGCCAQGRKSRPAPLIGPACSVLKRQSAMAASRQERLSSLSPSTATKHETALAQGSHRGDSHTPKTTMAQCPPASVHPCRRRGSIRRQAGRGAFSLPTLPDMTLFTLSFSLPGLFI
jgi:hypothetical protein